MSRTMTLCMRYAYLYISLPCSAKQQREMTSFKVLWRTGTHDCNWISLSLPELERTNSVPRQFGHIRRVKRVGIIVKWNNRLESKYRI